jgi:hypothetical protein
MTATTPEVAPGSTVTPAAPVTMTNADIEQLAAAMYAKAKADVKAEPSKFGAQVSALWADMKAKGPAFIVAVVAFAALTLHFVKLPL